MGVAGFMTDEMLIVGGNGASITIPVSYDNAEDDIDQTQSYSVGNFVFQLSPTTVQQWLTVAQKENLQLHFPSIMMGKLLDDLGKSGAVSFISYSILDKTSHSESADYYPVIASLYAIDGDIFQQISQPFLESFQYQIPSCQDYFKVHQWLCRQAIRSFYQKLHLWKDRFFAFMGTLGYSAGIWTFEPCHFWWKDQPCPEIIVYKLGIMTFLILVCWWLVEYARLNAAWLHRSKTLLFGGGLGTFGLMGLMEPSLRTAFLVGFLGLLALYPWLSRWLQPLKKRVAFWLVKWFIQQAQKHLRT